MKVFIGWSGDRSKHIAFALHEWLPNVIQRVTPWMSEKDIPAGASWIVELRQQLEETKFGIVVLTQENANATWIHFEAGALTKEVGESRVCPYLIDIEKQSEVTGPIAQFQMKKATEEDTLELLRGINQLFGEEKLTDNALIKTFRLWWPDLKTAIDTLPAAAAKEQKRDERELLEEVLQTVRSLERQSSEGVRLSISPGAGLVSAFLKEPFPPQLGASPAQVLTEGLRAFRLQNPSLPDKEFFNNVAAKIVASGKEKKKTERADE